MSYYCESTCQSYLLCFVGTLMLLTNNSSSAVTKCLLNSEDDVSLCPAAAVSCEPALLHNLTANLNKEDDEVVVYLCFSFYSLDSAAVVNFTDINSISLIGQSSMSAINCGDDNTAGFYFQNVNKLIIQNLSLSHCGLSRCKEGKKYNNMTFNIYIEDCSHVNISFVNVYNSSGTGVAIVNNNNNGTVVIANSSFRNSGTGNVGGGLVINSTTSGSYNIKGCEFTNNKFYRGSGFNARLSDMSQNVEISIADCIFDGNIAEVFGGALYITFWDNSQNITLKINQCHFNNNRAINKGGAINIGYNTENFHSVIKNSIQLVSCTFTENSAELGGGLYLFSYPDRHYIYALQRSITFENCNWTRNSASSGSAIYALAHSEDRLKNHPLFLIFNNCYFENNFLRDNKLCTERDAVGILQTCFVHIILDGTVEFTDNLESAVYMESGILEIKGYTHIRFNNNHGVMGGAIRMKENSIIKMQNNSNMIFTNNSACFRSGAIYYEDHSSDDTVKCFIEHAGGIAGMHINDNVSMKFSNNLLTEQNNIYSVYLSSSFPCGDPPQTLSSLIANFTNLNYSSEVSTSPTGINLPKNSSTMYVIPGKGKNVTFLDETGGEVEEYFMIEVGKNKSIDLFIDSYEVLHKQLRLRGKPESTANLTLRLGANKNFSLTVTLEHCPPGYAFNDSSKVCECSDTSTMYLGIFHCINRKYQAKLLRGYWAGYVNDTTSDKTFRTTICPLGYCLKQEKEVLPAKASAEKLSRVVCSENRHGRVCSRCDENTSVLFHTQDSFSCGSNDHYHCKYGILLYIVTELVPVTFLFVLIIVMDIQLTAGALNSFLFYAQIFSTLKISAGDYTVFPQGALILLQGLNFILSIFNLNFFIHPKLSFCIIKGARFLHIMIFDYITVIYSFLLVLLVIVLTNSRFNKIVFKLVKLRKRNFSKSIIHGLSGFLVICYARYTKASLKILTPTTLYGKGVKAKEKVLLYSGDVDFFSHYHLPYAIPAIFILITMTLMPPLLLFFFPLYYKAVSLLKMEESRFTKLLCKIVPLEKLMPFFDSFQGSFKDKYRHFAGLYFIYRLCALLLFSSSERIDSFYYLLQLQFILTLAFHAWIQPYKKKWHNRLDIYIFALLCIINGISMFTYEQSVNRSIDNHIINFLSTVQVLFAYTPLLIMLACLIFKVWLSVKARICSKKIHYIRERSRSDFTLSIIDRSREIEYEKYQLP